MSCSMTASVDFTKHAEAIGRHYFGEPNPRHSKSRELRWGENGSFKIDLDGATWYDFESEEGGGLIDLVKLREGYTEDREVFDWMRAIGLDIPAPGGDSADAGAKRLGAGRKKGKADRKAGRTGAGRTGQQRTIAALYDYTDEDGALLYQVVRYEPKDFRQRRPMGNDTWAWSITAGRYGRSRGAEAWKRLKDGERADDVRELEAVRLVPYRLPALKDAMAARREILIVEGEKDVMAAEALGFAATCNAGGSGKWSPVLAEALKGADVAILADNDATGRNHADKVAAALVGTTARVRRVDLAEHCAALPEKGDLADWVADHGGDAAALQKILDATPEWVPRAPEPPFPVFRFADLLDYRPKQEWLVDGWLGMGQFGVLFGPPKSGKSFMALDLAMHIAHGWPWLDDIETRAGGVFYIAAEGGEGVKKRMATWAKEFPMRNPNAPFYMSPHRFDLFSDETGITAIAEYVNAAGAATGTPFRLIVADTLARVFGPGDENFTGDMNRVIENCDRLRELTGCAVLLVHHSGKDASRGMRGAQSLYGAVDAVFEAKAAEDDDENEIPTVKTLTLKDQKDGEAGDTRLLALRQRILGHDDAGKPVTSCVIENVEDAGPGAPASAYAEPEDSIAPTRPDRVGDHDTAAQALDDAIRDAGIETDQGKAAHADAWIPAFQRRVPELHPGSVADRLRELAVDLIAQGRVVKVHHGGKDYFMVGVPF